MLKCLLEEEDDQEAAGEEGGGGGGGEGEEEKRDKNMNNKMAVIHIYHLYAYCIIIYNSQDMEAI